MVYKILFVLHTISIYLWHYIGYCWSQDYDDFIINLVESLGKINIFYVKICQTLAANKNLLSSKQIEYMSLYTDSVPFNKEDLNHDWLTSLDNLGKSNSHLKIDSVSNNPIKSGIIAVVYEGMMNGTKIAIKVKKNNLEEQMDVALDNLIFLYHFLSYFISINNLCLDQTIEDNREDFKKQLDFLNEVNNIEIMQRNFKNLDNIIIPQVYKSFTEHNNNVIIMGYIEGKHIKDVNDNDKHDFAKILSNYTTKTIMFDGFYHADLHSGNIIFIDDNNKKKIAILDYGICSYLEKENQNHYFIMANHLINKEYLDWSKYVMDILVEPRENVIKLTKTEFDNIINKLIEISKKIVEGDTFGIDNLLIVDKVFTDKNLLMARWFYKMTLAIGIYDGVLRELIGKESQVDLINEDLKQFTDFQDLFEC